MLTWMLSALVLTAQDSQDAAPPPQQVPAAEETSWAFSGNAYWSDPPGGEPRFTAILYADRGPLHLEGRWGYEDQDTGSVWIGRNYEFDGDVSGSIVPMAGVVFGQTDGIAPGLELTLDWRKVSFYSEAEYLFDAHDDDGDFFYSWSTLMYSLTDALSLGIVAERSKLVDSDYDVQRGLAVEYHRPGFGFALYAYNIGTEDSYAVVSAGLSR